jgi:L-ascorbate metabolism protein UlaG (beta-lactamase superfamily)
LVNFYGIRILTDPALLNRVGVALGMITVGPKRYITPALRPSQLLPVHLVLLSHAHMDHMDVPTLRRLPPGIQAVSAKSTEDILARTRLKPVVELEWNETTRFRCQAGELEIRAFEVKHWGERWPSEKPRGYNGYILRRENKAIVFAGDTAYTPLFRSLRAQGPFETMIMPIAAYDPWIWNHCTPEQALAMTNDAGGRFLIPVHHQTFRLSREPMHEPIERLQTALVDESERLGLRQIGETFVCG